MDSDSWKESYLKLDIAFLLLPTKDTRKVLLIKDILSYSFVKTGRKMKDSETKGIKEVADTEVCFNNMTLEKR